MKCCTQKKLQTENCPPGYQVRKINNNKYGVTLNNNKRLTWLAHYLLFFHIKIDLLGQMVGRQNARRGARRLFSVLQNKRLNQDLAYTLFDEIISALFPEIDVSASTTCKA